VLLLLLGLLLDLSSTKDVDGLLSTVRIERLVLLLLRSLMLHVLLLVELLLRLLLLHLLVLLLLDSLLLLLVVELVLTSLLVRSCAVRKQVLSIPRLLLSLVARLLREGRSPRIDAARTTALLDTSVRSSRPVLSRLTARSRGVDSIVVVGKRFVERRSTIPSSSKLISLVPQRLRLLNGRGDGEGGDDEEGSLNVSNSSNQFVEPLPIPLLTPLHEEIATEEALSIPVVHEAGGEGSLDLTGWIAVLPSSFGGGDEDRCGEAWRWERRERGGEERVVGGCRRG
jgi:hypothetical protein